MKAVVSMRKMRTAITMEKGSEDEENEDRGDTWGRTDFECNEDKDEAGDNYCYEYEDSHEDMENEDSVEDGKM